MPETHREIVPDRIEPVVAYRLWDIYRKNPLILRSYGWSTVAWPEGKVLVAFHDGYVENYPILHDISECPGTILDSSIKCGIYGTKELSRDRFNLVGIHRIAGQIYLWGLIVEHELGYRAEFAYPKCLYLDGQRDDVIRMVASNYKIPATEPPEVPGSHKLLEELDRIAIAITTGVPNATSRDTGV